MTSINKPDQPHHFWVKDKMKSEDVVKRLVEKFGSENVLIRSQFHIQVRDAKGLNDIWINKHSQLKARIFGNSNIIENTSLQNIIQKLKFTKRTDLQLMKDILDLAKVVKFTEQIALENEAVIFTDAGFKNGKARIAAVMVDRFEIEMKSKLIDIENICLAEIQAIQLGMSMHVGATIYNDNQSAVLKINDSRVKWICREENKAADTFGNLRM